MKLLPPSVDETVDETAPLPPRPAVLPAAERDELTEETSEADADSSTLLHLLRAYDREEQRREKTVAAFPLLVKVASGIQFGGPLACLLLALASPPNRRVVSDGAFICLFLVPFVFGTVALLCLQNWQEGKAQERPGFSSAAQQDVVTALLDHGDVLLTADALARATTFYTGDRDRLYDRLAQALALLPDDPQSLSPLAHRALDFCLKLPKAHAAWQTSRLPALQTAIRRYRTRNEIVALRAKKRRHD